MPAFDKYHKPLSIGDRVRWRTYDAKTKTAGYKFGIVSRIDIKNRKETLMVATVETWKDLMSEAESNQEEAILASLVAKI